MNKLFESSIAAVLRKAAPHAALEIATQDRSRTLTTVIAGDEAEPGFTLRPDLLLRQSGRVVVIADTKWKHLGQDRRGRPSPTEADMYQMHAYASAFQCHELALIYPWDESAAVAHAVFQLPETHGGAAAVDVLGVDVGDDALPLRLGKGPPALTMLFDPLSR